MTATDRDPPVDADDVLDGTSAPMDRSQVHLDARDLPPPEPLRRTLELASDLGDGSLLVQYNDRAPRHLYPKLQDRGLTFETVEAPDCTVTAIWWPE